LTQLHHFARRLGSIAHSNPISGLALLLVVVGLSGCRHKAVRFVIPQGAQVMIELEPEPDSDSPTEVAELPLPELPPLSPAEPPRPAPRRRPTPKEETPTVQVADATSAALAIGALSSGGEAVPEVHQQTQDAINAILKRIAALPAKTVDSQKKQLAQIRRFLDEAQRALNSGDGEAAQNLAVKAKLLMDDLEKR
jgi:hypothetical protein